MQTSDRGEVWTEVIALVESFPTTCCMPPARKGIRSIPDFLWSGVKLPIWFPAFLLAITYVVDVRMGHASPFWTSTLQYLSNNIKKSSRREVLTFAIALWSFRVHRDSNSQNGGSFGSVSLHSHTLPHFRDLLLACTLPNPCLGREPKVKVATKMLCRPKFNCLAFCPPSHFIF